MSNSYLIHVDTSAATTVTPGGQASVNKVNGNPFQCSVILGNRHRRIRAVSLKNAQIPIGFYNIRSPYNTVTINSVTYTVPQGNFSASSFIAVLNGIITNAVGVFAINQATSQVTFAPNVGSATLTVGPLTMLAFLGFTNGQSGTFITATYSYIMNFDTYLNVWIENLGQSSLEPSQITFKIPLNVNSGGILQWAELNQYKQHVLVTDKGVRLDRLNITVLDRYGKLLNNNGLDWSFTLEIEADT
jgi:hypothetical protein